MSIRRRSNDGGTRTCVIYSLGVLCLRASLGVSTGGTGERGNPLAIKAHDQKKILHVSSKHLHSWKSDTNLRARSVITEAQFLNRSSTNLKT